MNAKDRVTVGQAVDAAAKAGALLEKVPDKMGGLRNADEERYIDTAYKLLGQAQEILELLHEGGARSLAKLRKEYPHALTDEYRQRVDSVRGT